MTRKNISGPKNHKIIKKHLLLSIQEIEAKIIGKIIDSYILNYYNHYYYSFIYFYLNTTYKKGYVSEI